MTQIKIPTKVSKKQVLEAKIIPCRHGYDLIISYLAITRQAYQHQKKLTKTARAKTNLQQPATSISLNSQEVITEPSKTKQAKTEQAKRQMAQVRTFLAQRPETQIAAGDLGVSNLLTLTTNDPGLKPLIVDGFQLKAYNQQFNRLLGKYQTGLARMQAKQSSKISKIYTSRKIKRLYQKRTHYLHNALHVISTRLTTWCEQNRVQLFILGYNPNWKTGVSLGKKTNQHFVQLPFLKLIHLLGYKLANKGILMLTHEESYTSKCSFFDQESIQPQVSYAGTRIHRGLFRTRAGRLIQADVQASLNIGKKVAGESWHTISGTRGMLLPSAGMPLSRCGSN